MSFTSQELLEIRILAGLRLKEIGNLLSILEKADPVTISPVQDDLEDSFLDEKMMLEKIVIKCSGYL